MLRLIHKQTTAGALLINDIDDGLPNKTARRMVAPPDQYERDGYSKATKQKCYVPRVNPSDSTQAGYIDLQETDRVLLSYQKGTIAGLVKAGLLDVVSLTAGDIAAPTLASADLDVPTAGDLTLTGTSLTSIAPNVTSVIITGTAAKTLTAAQILAGGGTVSATSIVIPAATIGAVAAGTSSAQVKSDGLLTAVVALS